MGSGGEAAASEAPAPVPVGGRSKVMGGAARPASPLAANQLSSVLGHNASPLAKGETRKTSTRSAPSKMLAEFKEREGGGALLQKKVEVSSLLPAVGAGNFHYATRKKPPAYSFGARPNIMWTGESTDPKKDRHKMACPGPGAYQQKSTLGPQGRSHHSGFSIMSRPKTEEERRLAELGRKEELFLAARKRYESKERVRASSRQGSRESVTGRASPEMMRAPSFHKKLGPGVVWDNATLMSTVNADLPGPGAYKLPDDWGRSGRKFSMYGRLSASNSSRRSIRAVREDEPGPGEYALPNHWRSRSATPSAAFAGGRGGSPERGRAASPSPGARGGAGGASPSTVRDISEDNRSFLVVPGGFRPPTAFYNPGPGRYDHDADLISGGARRKHSRDSNTFGSAPRLPGDPGSRSSSPGPGAYFKEPETFGGLPTRSRPSSRAGGLYGGRSSVMAMVRAQTASPNMMRGGGRAGAGGEGGYGRSTLGVGEEPLPAVQSAVF